MAQPGTPDVGALLRETRERRGLTLRQLSATTRISIPVLRALEASDVSRIPGGIFGRSFVRAYAQEIGLDPEKTLRAFLDALSDERAAEWGQGRTATVVAPPPERGGGAGAGSWRFLLVGVTVVLLLIVLVVRGRWEPTGEMTWFQTLAGVPRAMGPAGLNAQPLTIEIHPTADCRVSLSVDGGLVLSRVMHAGEHVVYEARERVVAEVGNAGAFAFSINRQRGRLLGTAGEAVTLVIDRSNYRDFVVH